MEVPMSMTLHSPARCPQCHRPLHSRSMQGLCSACLAAATMETPTAPAGTIHARPGDRVGDYRLLEIIAEGGFGIVFAAQREGKDVNRVALKIFKQRQRLNGLLPTLQQEARTMAELDHPRVAKVYDADVTPDGDPYLVVELVSGGQPITTFCARHRVPLRERMEMMVAVCRAIQYLHNKGIVHRDIKPSNILIAEDAEERVIKIIDFGIAVVLGEETTHEMLLAGTPGYMSPEQAVAGPRRVDTGSDIYGLGVVFNELLTGTLPWDAATWTHSTLAERRQSVGQARPTLPSMRLSTLDPPALAEHAHACRLAPRTLVRRMRGDCDSIVRKCLQRDPADRYETANELAQDIERHLRDEPVTAHPDSALYRLRKLFLRRQLAIVVGLALFTTVSLGLFASFWAHSREIAARQHAEMRIAEVAVQTGRWKDALHHWDNAERYGYSDVVDLALKRAEAWIVFHDRTRAGQEYQKLLRMPDLSSRRNDALLRVGEFETFDPVTFTQGVQRVRLALANGLDAADQAFARALIADSSTNALASYRRALSLNPFQRSTHRHLLGLEFILGRHEDVATHLEILRYTQPGEFSPGFIESAEFALRGKTNEAKAGLIQLRAKLGPEQVTEWEQGLELLAMASEHFKVETYLAGGPASHQLKQRMMEVARTLLSRRGAKTDPHSPPSGLPKLPSVDQGIRTGFDGVTKLLLALDTDAAVEKVRDGWRRHPESLFPVFAGMCLEARHPREGARNPAFLAVQSELYQMGVNSPSVIPTLPQIARLLAVDVQAELATTTHSNAPLARRFCLTNLHQVRISEIPSAPECKVYVTVARQLGELDMAGQFLARWEELAPGDDSILRNRIRVKISARAYGPALKLLDQYLAKRPDEKSAENLREQVVQRIKELHDSVQKKP